MSKKSILNKNRRTLTPTHELDEQIFKKLREMRKNNPDLTITQTKLAERIGTNQPAISRHLSKLIGKEYDYYGYYYKIVCVDRKYKMIKVPKPPECDQKGLLPIEYRKQEQEIRIAGALEIRYNECIENNGVIDLGGNLIQYKVKKSKHKLVTNVLRSGFPEYYFYDIVSNSNGVYIILNTESLGARLPSAKKDIIDFYLQILNIKHRFTGSDV